MEPAQTHICICNVLLHEAQAANRGLLPPPPCADKRAFSLSTGALNFKGILPRNVTKQQDTS